jgi:hypothetical protein
VGTTTCGVPAAVLAVAGDAGDAVVPGVCEKSSAGRKSKEAINKILKAAGLQ